ncbi:MAG: hypothetical protein HYW05_01735 [Candidatus Diapherotrites archaeon]|nr:hypothetical protein [Candidatus Diapherotrites archaeon]
MAKEKKGKEEPKAGEREAPQEIQITHEQIAALYQSERVKFENIDARIRSVQNALFEINAAISALEEFRELKSETEVLVPLGSGVHINTRISPQQKIKMSLAGNVVLDVSAEKAIADLGKRREDTEKYLIALRNDAAGIASNISSLERAIMAAQQQRQQQSKADF